MKVVWMILSLIIAIVIVYLIWEEFIAEKDDTEENEWEHSFEEDIKALGDEAKPTGSPTVTAAPVVQTLEEIEYKAVGVAHDEAAVAAGAAASTVAVADDVADGVEETLADADDAVESVQEVASSTATTASPATKLLRP